MVHAVQRTFRPQDDRVLFRLSIPEISGVPQRAWNALLINFIQRGHADLLPQVFVHDVICRVDKSCDGVVTPRVRAALFQNLVCALLCFLRIHRKLQVVAEMNWLQLPGNEPPGQRRTRRGPPDPPVIRSLWEPSGFQPQVSPGANLPLYQALHSEDLGRLQTCRAARANKRSSPTE